MKRSEAIDPKIARGLISRAYVDGWRRGVLEGSRFGLVAGLGLGAVLGVLAGHFFLTW